MSTALHPLLFLAALYVAAAYALRPPAFVSWPGYRWIGQDLSRTRVSLAGQLRTMAETKFEDERARVRLLKDRVRRLDARLAEAQQQRDEAQVKAYAAVRLAESDALVIVRDMIEREAAAAGESGETVAGRLLRIG